MKDGGVRQDGTCLQMSDAKYGVRAVRRCNVFWLGVENQRGRTDEAGANEKSKKEESCIKRNGEQMKERSRGTRDGLIKAVH